MITVPVAMPPTTPLPAPTVPTVGSAELHVPPGDGSVSVMVDPRHTFVGPLIAAGDDETVTVVVVAHPPTVYVMVAVPNAMPLSNPLVEPIVATAVLLLAHIPPGIAFVSVVLSPAHIRSTPEIGPGTRLTVTTAMVAQPVMGKV